MDALKTRLSVDIEKQGVVEDHLCNTTVQSISWRDITVTVKDRETKLPKAILSNVSGIVHAGTIPLLLSVFLPRTHSNLSQAKSSPLWAPQAPARPLS